MRLSETRLDTDRMRTKKKKKKKKNYESQKVFKEAKLLMNKETLNANTKSRCILAFEKSIFNKKKIK